VALEHLPRKLVAVFKPLDDGIAKLFISRGAEGADDGTVQAPQCPAKRRQVEQHGTVHGL
jgi:hypothetical protein